MSLSDFTEEQILEAEREVTEYMDMTDGEYGYSYDELVLLFLVKKYRGEQ